MNPNLLLATLEHKGIITEEEASKLSEYIATSTQSTIYKDAQAAIKKLLDEK